MIRGIGSRSVISGLVAGLILAGSAGVASSEDLTVAVYSGFLGGVLKDTVVKPFQEESNLDVVGDDRDWGIGTIRTRIESGTNTWDVVTAEDVEVSQGCSEGLFTKLDTSKLPKLDDFITGIDESGCGLPLILYSVVLVYNKDKTPEAPTNWADFWDVKKWPGKRGLYKRPRDALEIALLADGVPGDKLYEVLATDEGIDRAFRKLDELKENIIWWDFPAQSRQMIASGEVAMVATFNGPIHGMNSTEGTNLGVVLTNAITHVDYWVAVEGSPQLENAYRFLSYTVKADVQAKTLAKMLDLAPNRNAISLLPPESQEVVSSTLANFEKSGDGSGAISSDPAFWLDNYEALIRRFNTWSSTP